MADEDPFSSLQQWETQALSECRFSCKGRVQTEAMPATSPMLTIGDFSRATLLTIKTLRHYHDTGLLEAAEVDPRSGYRRYLTSQIPKAQMIKRFRELRMPLNDIRQLLASPDGSSRNAIIAAHLRRLEDDLGRTLSAVSELRSLLGPPAGPVTISRRHIAPTLAAAIGERVEAKHAVSWLAGGLAELHSTLITQSRRAVAPAGGVFSDEIFAKGRGAATIYIPCDGPIESIGRVRPYHSPEVELATIVHIGSHRSIDLAYGALATHVVRDEVAADGPLWEHYLVGPLDTSDESAWRTEIGWPIVKVAERSH
jgi:DNA-binding transcriptional MerR regulator/effector-binding domain-containing protein